MAGKIAIAALLAGSALCLAAAAPSIALAGGTSGCGCQKPPPPPPPPPHKPPPPPVVNKITVDVVVKNDVTANSLSTSSSNSNSSSEASRGGGSGYAGGLTAPGVTGYVQGLDVGGETRTAYEATRTLYKKVVIQAFCFDDKMAPHPASQVTPDRDIDDLYEGELYRCIAGTHMQVTIADFKSDISFAGGQTLTCAKGEALYHYAGAAGHGGRIECRAQKPARDCNERSLLRRFGAGIKVLSMMVTEKYTAYREETSTSSGTTLSLDGGVGGVAY